MQTPAPRRQLGSSDLWVSPVALGCWPMSGVSSLGIQPSQCVEAIECALQLGVNHFDTAYSYGKQGESDRLLRQALSGRWDQVVVASKVGSHYDHLGNRQLDASPARLTADAEEIRQRLGLDRIDLMYLHAPDGRTPVERSAEALARLQQKGTIRWIGVSNTSPEETLAFASIAPIVVHQPPFNMLQQESLQSLRPALRRLQVGAAVYWPLMKGLLAGAIRSLEQLDPADRRLSYPMFQGEQWTLNRQFIERLDGLAREADTTIIRLVVGWTMAQPDVATVLCGARNAEQIAQAAQAMVEPLPADLLERVERLVAERTGLAL
ncbi:MAG: aldo/keto reductase [Pirellulaceae bacterium]